MIIPSSLWFLYILGGSGLLCAPPPSIFKFKITSKLLHLRSRRFPQHQGTRCIGNTLFCVLHKIVWKIKESIRKSLEKYLLYSIRWIASSYIAVDAVLNSYVSLSKHLLDAAQDAKRSSTQRASYKGFHSLLTSVHFLKNLAIMHDVLKELSNLSVVLQERSLIIPRAYKMIELYIVRIASLKESAGEKVNEVRDSEDFAV